MIDQDYCKLEVKCTVECDEKERTPEKTEEREIVAAEQDLTVDDCANEEKEEVKECTAEEFEEKKEDVAIVTCEVHEEVAREQPNSDDFKSCAQEEPSEEQIAHEQTEEIVQKKVGRKRKRVSVMIGSKRESLPKSKSLAGRPSGAAIAAFDNSEYQDWTKFETCAGLFVMGQGDAGQIGFGEEVQESKTPRRLDLDKKLKQIACGSMHTLILTVDGAVLSCGCNDEHALGRSGKSEDDFVFKEVTFEERVRVVKVCAGDSFSAALTDGGEVFAWGLFRDSNGPIGMVDGAVKAGPLKIYSAADACTNIASGSNHLLLLTKSGRVLSCGSGDEGQLGRLGERYVVSRGGRRSIALLVTPREVFFPLGSKKLRKCDFSKRVVRVFAAKNGSFAQMLDGSVYGWGLNNQRQLDATLPDFIFHPTLLSAVSAIVDEDDPLVLQIAGGVNHVLVLDRKLGRLFSSGYSDEGALGRASTDRALTLVNDPPLRFIECACGDACSFGISAEHRLYSWGLGCNQQLGFEKDDDVHRPTPIDSLAHSKVIQVSAGSQHAALLSLQ